MFAILFPLVFRFFLILPNHIRINYKTIKDQPLDTLALCNPVCPTHQGAAPTPLFPPTKPSFNLPHRSSHPAGLLAIKLVIKRYKLITFAAREESFWPKGNAASATHFSSVQFSWMFSTNSPFSRFLFLSLCTLH